MSIRRKELGLKHYKFQFQSPAPNGQDQVRTASSMMPTHGAGPRSHVRTNTVHRLEAVHREEGKPWYFPGPSCTSAMRSGGFVKSQALQIEHGSVVQGQFRGPHHVCVMATALPDLIPADHSVWSISEARSSSAPADRLGWLYRASMACYNKGCTEDVDKDRLQWLRKAHDYALEAHEMEPTDTDVLSVLCSATGKLAEDSTMIEKQYLDKAIAPCADSYEFLHMRGRFEYQVSTLSTVERTLARAIGTLPATSLEHALRDLLAADSISPDEIENIYFIGKTYDAMGDYKNAELYLQKVVNMARDPECVVECEYVEDARQILSGLNYS
ncbi:unnamed protein product [Heligmosomoides polygyrus]|uniref:TPR_REGION domain-containing protein n=1 Tax=Heligmosomoides polygyrus TaxID=6339 RepID=A0A3P7X3N7_HELPZ|nr:unnamed protein product [Heligmosomoides polygyrus]